MSDFDLGRVALRASGILIPAAGVPLERWAVVACDQYTAQPEYWREVEDRVGGAPSALRLILPEVYLGGSDEAERVRAIHAAMDRYQSDGVLVPAPGACIAIDRRTSQVPSRRGLVIALDLERYDFRAGARTLARATERTVESRLPSRLRVREGASLELPHVMVLIDDPERTVIEPLLERAAARAPLYDVELMAGGGHLRGWSVDGEAELAALEGALAALAEPEAFRRRYGVADEDVLLYAVGDGNHSLAAARLRWEQVRESLSGQQRADHPARHALVELVNLHDPGLVFEPIHRVVFDVDAPALLAGITEWAAGKGARTRVEAVPDAAALEAALQRAWSQADPGSDPGSEPRSAAGSHVFGFRADAAMAVVRVDDPPAHLPVGTLQAWLDDVIEKPDAIDYIHGADVVADLCAAPGCAGFLVPVMDKQELFRTVLVEGALPRKTFSMGEADEKRFYVEARRIVPGSPGR